MNSYSRMFRFLLQIDTCIQAHEYSRQIYLSNTHLNWEKVHVFKDSFASLDIHLMIKPMFSTFPKGL